MTKATNVVSLVPNGAIANDLPTLAERLRKMADQIERGEWGEVAMACVVLEMANGAPSYQSYGQATTNAHLVGVLEWVQQRIIRGD